MRQYDKAANYEVALAVLGSMMGLCSHAQEKERASAHPDPDRLAALQADHARLWTERHQLRPEDTEAINQVLIEGGAKVREGLAAL